MYDLRYTTYDLRFAGLNRESELVHRASAITDNPAYPTPSRPLVFARASFNILAGETDLM
jgi:hypothetical protein